MNNFICKRCGYNTYIRSNFKKHLLRKKLCPPHLRNISKNDLIIDAKLAYKLNGLKTESETLFYCSYCGKSFKNSSSRYRHQREYCKKKDLVLSEKEKNKHANDTQKIEELTSQVQSLLHMIMSSMGEKNMCTNSHNNNIGTTINNISNSNNITNNQITNNTQLQINTQINNYGSEDTSYITKEQYKEILQNPFTGLSKLINIVHFNDEHPENNNLRIPNKKQSYIEYYDNGWVIGNRYKFVCKLFFIKKEALHQAYLEVEDILDEKTKQAYKFFREETTLNPKTIESQLKDIQAAIMSGTRQRKEYLKTSSKKCPQNITEKKDL